MGTPRFDVEAAKQDYLSGKTLTEVADGYGVSYTTIRYHLKKAGFLRTMEQAQSLRFSGNPSPLKGRKRGPMSDEQKLKISISRQRAWDGNARGYRITQSGYVEYTTGPNKGRLKHVIVMEDRLGRPLKKDECVHHIDRDRLNNSIDNLSLMTRRAHSRLHRFEDYLISQQGRNEKNGRFS